MVLTVISYISCHYYSSSVPILTIKHNCWEHPEKWCINICSLNGLSVLLSYLLYCFSLSNMTGYNLWKTVKKHPLRKKRNKVKNLMNLICSDLLVVVAGQVTTSISTISILSPLVVVVVEVVIFCSFSWYNSWNFLQHSSYTSLIINDCFSCVVSMSPS